MKGFNLSNIISGVKVFHSILLLLGLVGVFNKVEGFYVTSYYHPSSFQRFITNNPALSASIDPYPVPKISPLQVMSYEQTPDNEAVELEEQKKAIAAPAQPLVEAESVKDEKLPRRTLRQLGGEFGSIYGGKNYRMMRPCFYSPIQCLMKKKRASANK